MTDREKILAEIKRKKAVHDRPPKNEIDKLCSYELAEIIDFINSLPPEPEAMVRWCSYYKGEPNRLAEDEGTFSNTTSGYKVKLVEIREVKND